MPTVIFSAPSYVASTVGPFLNSIDADRALLPHDLAGSIAHAEMLGRTSIVSPTESRELVAGLRTIARESRSGAFAWRVELEDVHTNVEVRLTELIGPVAGKLHSGRSRNDQVALDGRLYLRAVGAELVGQLLSICKVLLDRAEGSENVALPGYTHLQRAQPISLAHWWLAHFWRFERDIDRLIATVRRANVSPLGAGALAGSTLPVDPEWVAHRLGFDRSFDNSLDAVSDRDHFAELSFDLALFLVHASGLGEELVVFSTTEFGYLERPTIPGAGSSQMPQKRNPDAAELVRAKSARGIGDLVAILTMLKGLPLAYNRDLQEDRPAVFDSVATARSVLGALSQILETVRFDTEALARAAGDADLLATDRAEALVARGVPFRAAHDTVRSDPSGRASSTEAREALGRRRSRGGPSPEAVRAQVDAAHQRLAAHHTSHSSLAQLVARTEELVEERPT